MNTTKHAPELPARAKQLRPAWLHTMTPGELSEAAIWLQEDSSYLYRQARLYRDAGSNFVAQLVQENAAHSAALSRAAIAKLSASS